MKKIILCADDFAQNKEITDGILTLVEMRRLSAVSCMTHYSPWPEAAKALKKLIQNKSDNQTSHADHIIDVGLHFDLGIFQREKSWSFNQLILNALLGRIDPKDIERHLTQQLNDFEEHFGRAPDFVDGHQHVHSFPNIRKVFLQTLQSRYSSFLPYLRLSNPPLTGHDTFVKAVILKLLVTGFAQQASALGFKFPPHFNGAYSLTPTNYRNLFQGWLKQSPDQTLIMCHPGLESNHRNDPIRTARPIEFSYFASDDFLQDVKQANALISVF